jgi:pimeloyl-ACP methyl ester carboxylesterase
MWCRRQQLSLDFYEVGAPSDCIFIHGAGGNNLLWKGTLRYLSGEKRGIAVNLPGHPSGGIVCMSIGEYAGVIHGFLAHEDLRRATICGHSMGSAIALELALRHPEEVGGLVIVDGGAKLGVSPTILDGLSNRPLRAIEEIITPLSFHSVTLESGREARKALSLSNLEVFLNDYRACNDFDIREKLQSIGARTLIICGDDDRMTPPRYSKYLNEKIPNSSIHFIKNAGHMVPLERPDQLGVLIQSFLTELSR